MKKSKEGVLKNIFLTLTVIPILLFQNSCEKFCPILDHCAMYNHSDVGVSYCNDDYGIKACNGETCSDYLDEGEQLVVSCENVNEDWIGKCEWVEPSPYVARSVQYTAIPDCDASCMSADKNACESTGGSWSQP